MQFSEHRRPEFLKLWHYHPEVELVYIVQGQGTVYIGDFIGGFEENDIFLIGSELPHMFQNVAQENMDSIALVLHINLDFLNNFSSVGSEFSFIKTLITSCQRGLKFQIYGDKLKNTLDNLTDLSPSELSLSSIRILSQLNTFEKAKLLGSIAWKSNFKATDERMNKVSEFVMMNFKSNITLETIANLVGMNKNAFCRYFKQETGKTFISWVNEVRINYACKLLREEHSSSVTMACYDSGFNSLSYFNRIFNNKLGCSPSEYIKENNTTF